MTRESAKSSKKLTEQIDEKQLALVYQKAMRGEELNREEQRLLRRYENEKEERLRWQYYESIPRAHWREMSGRQTKTLQEQAGRWAIRFGGETINLREVVQDLHDFLARHHKRLMQTSVDEQAGATLVRLREEKAQLARLERLHTEGQLASVPVVLEVMQRLGVALRRAGELLQREFGPAALDIYQETLDEIESQINEVVNRHSES